MYNGATPLRHTCFQQLGLALTLAEVDGRGGDDGYRQGCALGKR